MSIPKKVCNLYIRWGELILNGKLICKKVNNKRGKIGIFEYL